MGTRRVAGNGPLSRRHPDPRGEDRPRQSGTRGMADRHADGHRRGRSIGGMTGPALAAEQLREAAARHSSLGSHGMEHNMLGKQLRADDAWHHGATDSPLRVRRPRAPEAPVPCEGAPTGQTARARASCVRAAHPSLCRASEVHHLRPPNQTQPRCKGGGPPAARPLHSRPGAACPAPRAAWPGRGRSTCPTPPRRRSPTTRPT